MGELFDPQKLTRIPFEDEILGPLSIIYLIVFVAGFATALWLYLRPPARLKAHALRYRLSQRFASYFMWAFGVGLVFFGFRVLGLPGLGIRLWLYVSALAVLAVAAYVIYYTRTAYPAELRAYEERQRKRQYQVARRHPTSTDGAPVVRSARAEKRRQRGGSTARGR